MLPWVETTLAASAIAVPVFSYFIILERKLAKIINDLCWIKKVLNARDRQREIEDK